MGNIIKVNFNNAIIKLPEVVPPVIQPYVSNKVLIKNVNTNYLDRCKMVLDINGKIVVECEDDYCICHIPEEAATIKIKAIIEGEASFYPVKKEFEIIYQKVNLCSELLLCSEELVCNTY